MELRAAYIKNENEMVFNIELMNDTKNTKEVSFSSGKQYEIYIVDEKGKEVYRYSDDKFFTMAFIIRQLKSGESLSWQEKWNYTNKMGEPMSEGVFDAFIEVLAMVETMDGGEGQPENLNENTKIEESNLEVVLKFNL